MCRIKNSYLITAPRHGCCFKPQQRPPRYPMPLGEHPAHRRRGRAHLQPGPRRPRAAAPDHHRGAELLCRCRRRRPVGLLRGRSGAAFHQPQLPLRRHGPVRLGGSQPRPSLRAGEQAAERLLTDRLPVSPRPRSGSAWSTPSGPTIPTPSTAGPGRSPPSWLTGPPKAPPPRSTPRPTGSGNWPTCGTTSSRTATASRPTDAASSACPPERTALGQHWSGHTVKMDSATRALGRDGATEGRDPR